MARKAAQEMKVRRVVAALHSQYRDGPRVAAIAEFARRMEGDLIGVFIEDVALLHLAALPFACEVGAASAIRHALDAAAVQRFMRTRAEELRRALAEALSGAPVSWSFRVERGTIPRDLLVAAVEEAGAIFLLPAEVDLGEEMQAEMLDELTEPRLRALLQGRRPVLILPRSDSPTIP